MGFDVPIWPIDALRTTAGYSLTLHGFTHPASQHSEKHSPVSFITASAEVAAGDKVAASILDFGMGLLLAHKIFVRSLNRRLSQPDWIDLKHINSSTETGNKQQD